MKVRVSGRDINEGVAHSIYFCPIALALQRQYPELQEVGVKGYLIFVRGDVDIPLIYGLTEHAKSFMRQFDAGGEVVESVFDLPYIDTSGYMSKRANYLRGWHKPVGIEDAKNFGIETWGEVDKNFGPKSKGVNDSMSI